MIRRGWARPADRPGRAALMLAVAVAAAASSGRAGAQVTGEPVGVPANSVPIAAPVEDRPQPPAPPMPPGEAPVAPPMVDGPAPAGAPVIPPEVQVVRF